MSTPPVAGPAPVRGAPRLFDSHLHVILPGHPLTTNEEFLPEPFTVDDYRRRTAGLNVQGGAVVSGSFQGFDQGYLLEALRRLGPGFVGVTQVPPEITDTEIAELDAAGVRGVRFNLKRGGSAGPDEAEALARRVWDLAGWHSEFYVDAGELGELERVIASLPAASVDHLGLSAAGLTPLLRLVDAGVKVKATGFGRVDLDPVRVMREVLAVNPSALMAGTDLPSTRARRAFEDSDLDLIGRAVGEDHLDAVLWSNARQFYRL